METEQIMLIFVMLFQLFEMIATGFNSVLHLRNFNSRCCGDSSLSFDGYDEPRRRRRNDDDKPTKP